MKKKYGEIKYIVINLMVGMALILSITGCQPTPQPTTTIGILTLLPAMEQIVVGFKEGMTEQGYVEGKNVNYIYAGAANEVEKLDVQVQELVKANVDIIISVTTPGAQSAQRAIQGTDIPLVFIAVTDPIVAGLVQDLNKHEENITGILAGGKGSQSEGRRLELFRQLAPEMKTLYLPFNPDDPAAMENVKAVRGAAESLSINLIEREVRSKEEALAAVVPAEGVNGVFLPNDRLIGSVIADFIKAANERNLPTSLNNPVGLESGALMAYGPDFKTMGKQGARLVNQIIQGISASELPVEVPELLMGINLKTAKLINLPVSDEMLGIAAIILR